MSVRSYSHASEGENKTKQKKNRWKNKNMLRSGLRGMERKLEEPHGSWLSHGRKNETWSPDADGNVWHKGKST